MNRAHAMMTLRKLVTLLTLCSGGLPAAHAACTQADLRGNWYLNTFSVSADDGLGYWARCKLVVNSAGAFGRTTSICRFDTGFIVGVSGRLSVKSSCIVAPATITFFDGFGAALATTRINFAVVDRGKSVMNGVGDAGFLEPYTFVAVKP